MSTEITLAQVRELAECFGGDEECSMTLTRFREPFADPEEGNIHPAGLYAYFTDYQEEGCIYLGPGLDEVLAQEADDKVSGADSSSTNVSNALAQPTPERRSRGGDFNPDRG